uniref:Tudor domain-containing protein n=1 Tax=Toxocara canis TaxID=6265 RepID=A0A183U171_TOXCA
LFQLALPEGCHCEVLVCSIVDAGHFFVQQPAHPSYQSLSRLDCYMFAVYSISAGIPQLPKPCEPGLLCAAPANGGWFRAVTVACSEVEDEVLVQFVDYGGYSSILRSDLRQIRSDFMSLPFQAAECYLAHVQPVDGSSSWSSKATKIFQALTTGRVVDAFVVGHDIDDMMI